MTGAWVTNEEGGGDWTIDVSGKTTYDNKDYGPKYYIKEDATGALRRGDGWVSGPESTADRLVWTFKGKTDLVWIRSHRLKLQQGQYILFLCQIHPFVAPSTTICFVLLSNI